MIKKALFLIIMKTIAKKNMLSPPKIIQLPAMKFVGYKITTTLKNNRQKEDIPLFYHDIYDNNKLNILKPDGEYRLYCIFNLNENREDLDYYVAVENKTEISGESYARVKTPAGKYIQVEFIKRNNKTVNMIMLYIRNIWMKSKKYNERKSPTYILYDERFHSNFQKYGRRGHDYLGNPIATLFLPIES
jgi:AraC family transcriptional regulator